MAGFPFRRRKFHVFLSHSHADKVMVDRLHEWLVEVCGIPVWYDARHLPAGATVVSSLPDAIDQCRAMMIILSQASLKSGWVKKEYEYAEVQRINHQGFRIIPVRSEACEVPGFLQTTKWIDLPQNKLDLATGAQILTDLYYDEVDLEFESTREVYVSRTWHEGTEAIVADWVCELLIKAGFRLIGDSKDQEGFSEDRIKSLICSCGGFVAILPDRGQGKTSRYIVRETEIARTQNMPNMVVAEPQVELPQSISASAIRIAAKDIGINASAHSALKNAIATFEEEWREATYPHFVFFGTEIAEQYEERNARIRQILQFTVGTPCIMGTDIREGQIQQEIAKRISRAAFLIIDISEDNLNTCIEAGMAVGAGTRFHLVARKPRRRPPFMFRDQQVWYYGDDVELLGIVHRIAHPYRRRVLNWELQK